jgi:hypothetical protein
MPLIAHCGYILVGDNRIIDRAGWQCTAADPDEPRGRCRFVATHVHRRRDSDQLRFTALCPTHYELAGPEAAPPR